MRLFRVIGKEERDALLENGDTLKPHKTCKVPHWILNQHPEDYETGKYFFFELEDVLKYAKETYGSSKKCALFEINVDESLILPYLGFGVYCYADYEDNGMWNNNLSHCIPEVLLPYQVVDKAIKTNSYRLTDLDKKALLRFHDPFNKYRSPELICLGKVVSEICFAKNNFKYWESKIGPDKKNTIYDIEWYEDSKNKIKKYEPLLPPTIERFIESHRNYSCQLSDFINVSKLDEAALCE